MKTTYIPAAVLTLRVIAAVGVIACIAVAPGLGIVFKRYGIKRRLQGNSYVPTILSRLKKKGLVRFEGEGSKRHVAITDAGRGYLMTKRASLTKRKQTRRWDGYWRIVMFDIPESQKNRRDALRRELMSVGFKKLQRSIWVSPDECEEYVKLLKADRHIGKCLLYLKTKDIEYGSSLRKYFAISRT